MVRGSKASWSQIESGQGDLVGEEQVAHRQRVQQDQDLGIDAVIPPLMFLVLFYVSVILLASQMLAAGWRRKRTGSPR